MIRVEIVGETTVEIQAEAQRLIDTLNHLATEDRILKDLTWLNEIRPRLVECARGAPENRPTITTTRPLMAGAISDGFALIEKDDRRVAFICISGRDFGDLRNFSSNILDPETRYETLKAGRLGHVWGAEVLTDIGFPPNTVMFADEALTTFSQIKIVER